MPPLEEYEKFLQRIWKSGWVTNRGPLLLELEEQLKKRFDIPYLRCVANGTLALQLAIKALDLKNEIITTPFSYVATTSSIAWEGCKPVFADIDPLTWTIDPEKIEKAITPQTTAILATHVYGIPCDVDAIAQLADKYGLKVIYDAAHCFDVSYKGRSILEYGDISTLSFHATKVFHTIEGGAVFARDAHLDHRISYLMNFGHDGPVAFHGIGINAKNSEFHAAMGLSVLPHVKGLIERRQAITSVYNSILFSSDRGLRRPQARPQTTPNYSYYPILFPSEKKLLETQDQLFKQGVSGRRYFYPCLGDLPYVNAKDVSIARDISSRIFCLPIHGEMQDSEAYTIANLVIDHLT